MRPDEPVRGRNHHEGTDFGIDSKSSLASGRWDKAEEHRNLARSSDADSVFHSRLQPEMVNFWTCWKVKYDDRNDNVTND